MCVSGGGVCLCVCVWSAFLHPITVCVCVCVYVCVCVCYFISPPFLSLFLLPSSLLPPFLLPLLLPCFPPTLSFAVLSLLPLPAAFHCSNPFGLESGRI